MQAADKHYVDSTFSLSVPMTGANMTGPLTSVQLEQPIRLINLPGPTSAPLRRVWRGEHYQWWHLRRAQLHWQPINGVESDRLYGQHNRAASLRHHLHSAPGHRHRGNQECSFARLRFTRPSNASGSQGGTVFLSSGAGAMVQIGDPTYTSDTLGFHLDNAVINTTASTISTAQVLIAYRTQEMDLQSLYFLGNSNQTGMTLDGTGNYTGGTFYDNAFNGFQTAVNAIGHQVSNSAVTDWLNASTFVRVHIDCPTSAGNPISGTYGINLLQGDGNTFTGGDVEGCDTALHLGPNAQNNTIVGLRNENSNNQVVADSGSSYNNWMTGGTHVYGQAGG